MHYALGRLFVSAVSTVIVGLCASALPASACVILPSCIGWMLLCRLPSASFIAVFLLRCLQANHLWV